MFDVGHYETELIIRETEADITRVYQQAVAEMQKKTDEYFRKYKVKDLIKREQLARGEITQAEYNYWKTGQVAIGKRWEEMRDNLAQDLHNANNLARSVVQGHMPDVYALNHNYGTFQVEKESLVDTSYTLYDRQTVERLIREQPDILPAPGRQMREKIAANKDIAWQKGQIQSVVTQSILQGESIPNMAKRICNTLGEQNRKAAVRYARTASTAAQNAGRVDSYKRAESMGIELEKEWLATLDHRTRHEHRQLDGQHVPNDEPFKVGGAEIKYPGDPSAPGHLIWNCRCTLVPKLASLDQSNAPRNSRLENMSYEEWLDEHSPKMVVNIPGVQGEIGRAKSVQEVNDIMNRQGWFRVSEQWVGDPIWNEEKFRYEHKTEIRQSMADLTGCDLESAKSVASAYQQIFEKYPQLKGRFDAPNAHPVGMEDNTFAWCYTTLGGEVQVNPKRYSNWAKLVEDYNGTVTRGFHPYGTTAESIVTHEIGHAVDGLLGKTGILGGYTKSGEFRTASSSLKQTVMNRTLKNSEILRRELEDHSKVWGKERGMTMLISDHVSGYATENGREWFAECFAEYITSANPREIATEFGKALETLLEKLV